MIFKSFTYDQVDEINAFLKDNDNNLLARNGTNVFADRIVFLYSDLTLEQHQHANAQATIEKSIIDMYDVLASQEANRRYLVDIATKTGHTKDQEDVKKARESIEDTQKRLYYHLQVLGELKDGSFAVPGTEKVEVAA